MKLYIHIGGSAIHYKASDYSIYSANTGSARNGSRKSLIYGEMQRRRKGPCNNDLQQKRIKSEKTNPI